MATAVARLIGQGVDTLAHVAAGVVLAVPVTRLLALSGSHSELPNESPGRTGGPNVEVRALGQGVRDDDLVLQTVAIRMEGRNDAAERGRCRVDVGRFAAVGADHGQVGYGWRTGRRRGAAAIAAARAGPTTVVAAASGVAAPLPGSHAETTGQSAIEAIVRVRIEVHARSGRP